MEERDIYTLLSPVLEPESGPRLESGELVFLMEWCGDFALVESCEDHEDSGDGLSEPTMEQSTAWVLATDLEPVEEN